MVVVVQQCRTRRARRKQTTGGRKNARKIGRCCFVAVVHWLDYSEVTVASHDRRATTQNVGLRRHRQQSVAVRHCVVRFETCRVRLSLSYFCRFAFCETFHQGWSLSAQHFLLVIAMVVFHYFVLLSLAYVLSTRVFHFERPATVACCVCASQKTLALALPLLELFFADNPQSGVIALPLLLYHPGQVRSLGVWRFGDLAPRSTHRVQQILFGGLIAEKVRIDYIGVDSDNNSSDKEHNRSDEFASADTSLDSAQSSSSVHDC